VLDCARGSADAAISDHRQHEGSQLAESGNLLMLPSRSSGSEEWISEARALIDASTRALKAIDAKDKDALFTIGGDIYDVCTSCHRQFALNLAPRP
jgi:hypothetical protein